MSLYFYMAGTSNAPYSIYHFATAHLTIFMVNFVLLNGSFSCIQCLLQGLFIIR